MINQSIQTVDIIHRIKMMEHFIIVKIDGGQVTDDTNHCYGLAFVLLAYSCSLKAGIEQAKEWIRETFDLIEKYFWLEDKAKRIAEVMTKCHEELNNQIWKYFVDHQYGTWFRLLKQNNEKSPVGKTDYHTMGACYDVLNVI